MDIHRRLRLPAIAAVIFVAAQCSSKPSPQTKPTTPPPTSPSVTSSSPSPTLNPLVAELPDGCDAQLPDPAATVAFVSSGRAWAVGPDGSKLVCLFDVSDPGPFLWGPRGDRVALAGLAIKGVGVDLNLPAKQVTPTVLSWGRPTGKAVVFTEQGGQVLQKDFLNSAAPSDISPLDSAIYGDVVYHPSGLAIGFTATQSNDASEVWMASNDGTSPQRLVFSAKGTAFGPLAFTQDGRELFYGARLADGTRTLNALTLESKEVAESLWSGGRDILRVVAPTDPSSPGALLDAGSDCSDREALFTPLDEGPGTPLLKLAGAPTTAIGWLDRTHALVGEGGCDQPMNLWVADVSSGEEQLLVGQADRGSVRVPEPLPAPPLPAIGVDAGFA